MPDIPFTGEVSATRLFLADLFGASRTRLDTYWVVGLHFP
jgi:hypothetical protein